MFNRFSNLFISVMIILSITISITDMAFAHSGRTDSSGGHHDYNNVSGLGSYHFHHGYGPHLHTNGICPYDEPTYEPILPNSSNINWNAILNEAAYRDSQNELVKKINENNKLKNDIVRLENDIKNIEYKYKEIIFFLCLSFLIILISLLIYYKRKTKHY